MSFSPPIRRLSNASSIVNAEPAAVRKHEEELINAYEAEEERIINVLSRKLEQVSVIPLPLHFTYADELL